MASDSLLQRPLYVFDLPENILETLVLRTRSSQATSFENEIGSDVSDSDSEDEAEKRAEELYRIARQPLIWLGSSSVPSDIALGVYRVLFPLDHEDMTQIPSVLKQKQLTPDQLSAKVVPPQTQMTKLTLNATPQPTGTSAPTYFLCMIGGGHFAAMVVSLIPKTVNKQRQPTILAHKTFHRYTTRRKQGGGQSANDNAKGAAHSAGAALRRYNETALTTEIRALLTEWKSMIDACELIFVRATGSNNRKTMFGPYDGQVLSKDDPRNRGFPFTTRRATQTELARAFMELTRLKVERVEEAPTLTSEKKARDPIKKSEVAAPPKPTPEEEALELHTSQITSLIKRSKIPALLSYATTNAIDLSSFTFAPTAPHHTPTPLHLASHLGHGPVVQALLEKSLVDPTVQNSDGKTSYELAKDRQTRDAFRTARYTLGEERWDWAASNVDAPLSAAQNAARAAEDKKAELEESRREAERRRAETERLRKEDVQRHEVQQERRFGVGTLLGSLTGAEKREEQSRGMTPEMRMQLERERRARAAEARFNRS